MELKTLVLGMFIALSAFSVKAGIGWAYLCSRRPTRHKIGISCAVLASHALLFAAAYEVVVRVNVLARYDLFIPLWRSGVALHWITAIFLFVWGLFLLKSRREKDGCGNRSRAWIALLIPCPVCCTVILMSASCLALYFPDEVAYAVAGLFVLFVSAAALGALAASYGGTSPEETLAQAMIMISLYFIVSALVVPQFAEIGRIYRLTAYSGGEAVSVMNIKALLESAIYIISTSMLYPALVLLVGGFAVVVLSLGAFIAEWGERKRMSQKSGTGHRSTPLNGECAYISDTVLEDLDKILRIPGSTWDDVESLLRSVRRRRWNKLDYLRILARLGPAMGLVGTLIPMSTGLAALSQGDTGRLAADLVVAFSTTVVGLCYGVAAHILYVIRARWLEEDLENVQLAIEARAARVLDK